MEEPKMGPFDVMQNLGSRNGPLVHSRVSDPGR